MARKKPLSFGAMKVREVSKPLGRMAGGRGLKLPKPGKPRKGMKL